METIHKEFCSGLVNPGDKSNAWNERWRWGTFRDHAVPAGNTDLAPTGDDPTGAGPEGQGLNPNIDKKRESINRGYIHQ